MAPGQSHRAGASSGGSVQVNVAACSGGAARRAKRRGACEAPRASSRQCCAAHRGSIPDTLWHPSEKPVASMTWRANWRPFGLTICTRRRFRADRPVCAHGSETEARDHVRRTKYPRTATLAARVGKRQWSIFCPPCNPGEKRDSGHPSHRVSPPRRSMLGTRGRPVACTCSDNE